MTSTKTLNTTISALSSSGQVTVRTARRDAHRWSLFQLQRLDRSGGRLEIREHPRCVSAASGSTHNPDVPARQCSWLSFHTPPLRDCNGKSLIVLSFPAAEAFPTPHGRRSRQGLTGATSPARDLGRSTALLAISSFADRIHKTRESALRTSCCAVAAKWLLMSKSLERRSRRGNCEPPEEGKRRS